MIAGLPMYDRPELFEAHNKFWQLVHEQITGSPKILSRNISPWDLWTSPKLFLAQTCSSPYRESLHKIAIYVGTADYALQIAQCLLQQFDNQSAMKFQKLKIVLLVTMRKCLIRAGPLPWLTSES